LLVGLSKDIYLSISVIFETVALLSRMCNPPRHSSLIYTQQLEEEGRVWEGRAEEAGEPSSEVSDWLVKQNKLSKSGDMEELGHLLVFAFLFFFSSYMVAPVITDVTMEALCPGQDECSLAIYLTGLQQAVSS
jgi:hypothetical protein